MVAWPTHHVFAHLLLCSIAGQTGWLGNDSPYTLLIGCGANTFGHIGA